MDAAHLVGKKKTKVLRGETAKKVLARVSKKDETKHRSQAEKRKAIYGSES